MEGVKAKTTNDDSMKIPEVHGTPTSTDFEDELEEPGVVFVRLGALASIDPQPAEAQHQKIARTRRVKGRRP
jgi:hypothetical protein